MKKRKIKAASPVVTLILFAVAVALLLGSSIGGARAALTYYSDTYESQIEMNDIGITLLENGAQVSYRNYNGKNGEWDEKKGTLLENMLSDGKSLILGKKYDEELKLQNTGTINEYVRVSIYKYWLDEDENNKLRKLSPKLIKLNLVNLVGEDGSGDWIEDTYAKTEERTVLYYNKLLEEGKETSPFADSLIIDDSIATKVSQKKTKTDDGYTTIVTTYDYNGVSFRVEVEADAVQEHNVADAAWSAWGRRVSVGGDGILQLVD